LAGCVKVEARWHKARCLVIEKHNSLLHLADLAVGAPIPRIQCPPGYTAILYAQGASSPDGLAFSPSGVLHVAEETAGRVSRIEPGGSITTVVSGLDRPEGIAFDTDGNLYVVEDIQNGRLVQVTPGGSTTALATGLDAPGRGGLGLRWHHVHHRVKRRGA